MKKILKKLHLYLALIFCLPLIIQGLSGSMMVFRSEISDFILQQNYKFSEGQNHSASEIIAAAKRAFAESGEENASHFSVSLVRIPYQKSQPAIVRFNDKKISREVLIDAASLQVIKIKNPAEDFFFIIKKLHTNLLIENPQSLVFIGCYGFILLFMAISGIILWWPKSQNFMRSLSFNFKARGVALHRNLHKTFGFWSYLIILAISFSGIYLAFPDSTAATINAILHNNHPQQNLREIKIETQELQTKFNLEKAITEIHAALLESGVSEPQLISINFPQKPDQPYRFNFADKNYERGEPLITTLFNHQQNKIITIRNPESYNAAEKIITWQHAIHTGEGLGIIWQLLVFFTGFLPLIFSITGIIMWRAKPKRKTNLL